MRNWILLMLWLLLLSSCRTDEWEQPDVSNGSQDVSYAVKVEVESPVCEDGTRSSFTEDDMNKLTDLNVLVYHSGRLLKEYSFYVDDLSLIMLSFPFDKDGFNIYMAGNVGRLTAPEYETDLERLRYVVDSYEDFRVRGVPVAEVFRGYKKGTLAHFKLKRLVGQYNVKMKTSASDAEYKVKDVRLLNCALDMYPFSQNTKAVMFAGKDGVGLQNHGDMLTEDDIVKLNEGKSVSLYFVENLQGELLPGNTDRKKKIPSSLEALEPGLSECCTYIEITADITTPSAKYTDGKFRFYLGQNQTTDFSIKRNTLYDVVLDFTQNMVSEEEWRIEVGEPEVGLLTFSKEMADVVYGINDYILISGPKVAIRQAGSSDDWGCSLSDVVIGGKEYQKLTFCSFKDIVGQYSWGIQYRSVAQKGTVVLETVEKYNGKPLAEKTIRVNVYDKAFPVFLRVGSNGTSTPYQLEAVTDAPIHFELELYANLKVDVKTSGNVSSQTYGSYYATAGETADGYKCCCARFGDFYNSLGTSSEKDVYFRRMDVTIRGKKTEYTDALDFYMGDGGETYWGPGSGLNPQRFADLATDADVGFSATHSCSVSGCVNYRIYSGSVSMFLMAPKGRTCSTVYTTGTSNSLSYDVDAYNSGKYLPFYLINGQLEYSYPVTLLNESTKYMEERYKSIRYEMYGPGRDVFYPNGVKWGSKSEMAPGKIHRFGYTACLKQQFFGNVHTWQTYQDYECDFFMTVNGCTAWPGASKSSTGFQLAYNL